MTRIVTMGSEFFVTAFKIQGLDGYVVSQSDFNKMLDVILADKTISIVFLQEEFYFANQDRLDLIKSTITRPLFVEVPLEKRERQIDPISNLIKKTIGISLD